MQKLFEIRIELYPKIKNGSVFANGDENKLFCHKHSDAHAEDVKARKFYDSLLKL